MPRKASGRRSISDDHKRAIARGRVESAAVRRYLETIEDRRPGRRQSAESLEKRRIAIEEQLPLADPLRRLSLAQERIDLERRLKDRDRRSDGAELEQAFIEHALAYSRRKGISYAAWREVGVAPSVLASAGITRRGG